ncbi:hypothetical protein CYMTET_29837 [Cymbomonas tetramitiformis]|uniref:Uncharacterized protein n=1 Tax=Cymbomonas tetramitiformis TaxID=36881 RepID=A0AAE0FK92_9CHLO|nr:hypothetical protein CYMTET_29837 [Cymbomonas tetramitiformis]
MSFNAALAAARRKNTLDEDDVKGQFIQAMDSDYYRSVVSRLLLHDQRAAESLLTIHSTMGTRMPCGSRAGWRGCAEGGYGYRQHVAGEVRRPARWTQFRDNDVMAILLALRKEDVEGDFYAAVFQHAIDSNDTERFDALWYLAGGKPVMLEDLSTASFCVGDAVEEHAIDEYLQCCQPADARFGVCGVGGALHINTFKVHGDVPVVPPPPAAPVAPPPVVSDGGMYPVDMLHAHEPNVSFMDKIAEGFGRHWALGVPP